MIFDFIMCQWVHGGKRIPEPKACHMKIVCIEGGTSVHRANGRLDADGFVEEMLAVKAAGLAERGHEVWWIRGGGQAPGRAGVSGQPCRVLSVTPPAERVGGEAPEAVWMAEVVRVLRRLHADQGIDIIDIPVGLSGWLAPLATLRTWGRMPALVQVGPALPGCRAGHEAGLPVYRFDSELRFCGSTPVEAHIAILRLENFYHGVLNRHLSAQLPAA
jgi:hypothetical protein